MLFSFQPSCVKMRDLVFLKQLCKEVPTTLYSKWGLVPIIRNKQNHIYSHEDKEALNKQCFFIRQKKYAKELAYDLILFKGKYQKLFPLQN